MKTFNLTEIATAFYRADIPDSVFEKMSAELESVTPAAAIAAETIDTINTSDFCKLVEACRPYGDEGMRAHKQLVAHIDAARQQAREEAYARGRGDAVREYIEKGTATPVAAGTAVQMPDADYLHETAEEGRVRYYTGRQMQVYGDARADEARRGVAEQRDATVTDKQIYDTLGHHGALPTKDGAPERIIKGREQVLIQAIRAILSKAYAATRLRDVRALTLEGLRTIAAAQPVPEAAAQADGQIDAKAAMLYDLVRQEAVSAERFTKALHDHFVAPTAQPTPADQADMAAFQRAMDEQAQPTLPDDERAAFDAAFLSLNGFHSKAELDNEWEEGLSGEMFRAGRK